MSTATALQSKPSRKELKKDEVLCDYCTAKCCRYFALPVDTPKTWKEFEYLRWYVLHGGATIFLDEGSWYLMVHSACKHLLPDNRCGIYETRPDICREYSTKNCEYEDDWTYENYFETPEQIHEYAEAVLQKRRGKGIRSPKPPVLPIIA